MNRFFVCILLFTVLSVSAQQNVTIGPNDDAIAILQTVIEPGSTITFEAGYYSLTPKSDGTGHPVLFQPPSRTTIRGAGSGFGRNATVLDCEYAFDTGVKIGPNVKGIVVQDLTLVNTIHALVIIKAGSSGTVFNNVWALKCHDECIQNEGGEVAFQFSVFGWCSDNVFLSEDTASSSSVFTNCDLFLGPGDLVQSEAKTQVFLRNCILYAGPGGNDIHVDGGYISVRASVGWDPVDDDPSGFTPGVRLGRLELDGYPDVNATNVGQDPLYVKPPGRGHKASTMDLHLQEGSPALTAGRESFGASGEPMGGTTYAGSQGPVPVDVENWFLY
ncbi:MAG: hypothetical protein ABIH23_03720 [bacterium]